MNRLVISLFCAMCFACAFQTSGTKTTDDDLSFGGASQTDSFSRGGSSTQRSFGGSGGIDSIPVSTGGSSGFGGASLVLTGGSTSQATIPATGGSVIATGGRENTGGQLNQTGGSATGGMPATGGSSETTATGGAVSSPTIRLASDTPAASRVSRGALDVAVLRIWLSGDLPKFPVSTLRFQDIGSGHRADIAGVYLYDDSTNARITTVKSITASSKIISFSGLSIPSPTTITVMCDISNVATLNVTHIFQLTDVSYVTLDNDGVIKGDFPITGNSITISAM